MANVVANSDAEGNSGSDRDSQLGPKKGMRSSVAIEFVGWLVLTLFLLGVFVYVMLTEHEQGQTVPFFASTKTMLLPGETTHGHYQIELACSACHTAMMGVKQDACLGCHQQELKAANDTHPAKKFNDPTNAERLKLLDAQKCITCHREHVPERTHPMGLSLPTDYCYHCHQDVMEQRPSHKDFAFNSCATAGCHNYHDNRALYENFLNKHRDEPDMFDDALVSLRQKLPVISAKLKAADAEAYVDADTDADAGVKSSFRGDALTRLDADAADGVMAKTSEASIDDWATTAHAAAGVNCNQCHLVSGDKGLANQGGAREQVWSDTVDHQRCGKCHENELAGFTAGRHGMRLALGLSPMTPAEARHRMKPGRAHESLNCSACHSGHRFDTQYAAVEACLSCHNDRHSLAYQSSRHYELWQSELAGQGDVGTGVSCATCHMPTVKDDDGNVYVQHNQNDNLRPNEKMIRSVCGDCHGVAYSIDALADQDLIDRCFGGQPAVHIQSVDMVKAWFDSKAKKRKQRKRRSGKDSAPAK